MSEPTNDAFVAFLDVLGFRDLVTRNDHRTLEKIYHNAFITTIESGLAHGAFTTLERDGRKFAVADAARMEVNSMLASDCVLFWTNDNAPKNFIRIVTAVRGLMLGALYCGLPLRGAITMGPITAGFAQIQSKSLNFHNAVFGRAIVDAYELEKAQEWSGCVIDRNAVNYFESLQKETARTHPEIVLVENLVHMGVIKEYKVPFKSQPRLEYVVDWVSARRSPVAGDSVRHAFLMHNKSVTKPETQTKIQNTVDFVTFVEALRATTPKSN